MLDYKRKQEEELTKRMLEERNREKAEDRAARARCPQANFKLLFLSLEYILEITSSKRLLVFFRD